MSEEEKVVQDAAEEKAEAAENETPETEAAEEKPADAGAAESGSNEDDINTKYLRVMAEYQNFRTRTAKEKADIYANANEKIICELLGIIDNFERAMQTKPEGDSFADGIELILKQLVTMLDKYNVKEIETEGKAFDPNFHSAVMTEDVDGVESGMITKVFQKGYLLNSKVIRPAMVAVSN